MSRRPDGKRGRRKPDPAEETASWLLEVEQAGQAADEDEDDWSGALRATRREATGQFPPVPRGGEDREAPPPREAPSAHQAPRRQDPPQQPVGGDTGGWGSNTGGWGGAPAPREPEPWDTQAGAESWNGRWPFEESGQSWEPDDRSYSWPVQEMPSNTGSWDNADQQGPWGGGQSGQSGQSGQGSYEPGSQAGGYPPPNSYDSSSGYGSPQGYEPTGYEQPLARPYLDQGAYQPNDAYPASNGYGPTGQESYGPVDNAQTEQGYGSGSGYDQGYGAQDPGYGQADSSYPADTNFVADPGFAGGNGYASRPSDYATGELRGGEYGPGAGDASDSGYPPGGTYPPSGGRFGPENGYRADAGYPPSPAYDPPADPYPGAGGYDNGYDNRAAQPYGSDGPYAPNDSRDPYATGGEPFQVRDPYARGNQPQASAGAPGATTGPGAPVGPGPGIGGIGAGAPGIAGQPSRPDIWPAQTGSWQLDEPARPRGGASGEFSRQREDDDEQVVRLGTVGAGAPGTRSEWGSRPRGVRGEARPVDADGGHISTRARWPKVIALISWIILLMVLCWFYVFPFLERILPENF